ncbi:MAG: DUF6891 domain-containing protein, partial [Micromonosporaceae bacterium]
VEVFLDETLDPDGLRAAARVITDRALAAHLAEQSGWSHPTDCDRLDAAFADLAAAGILARQHFSCCGTCGANDIREAMQQAEKDGYASRGYTFFHLQDTEHAVAGDGLYLSYGARHPDEAAAVAIGHEIVMVLRAHGLAPTWNGRHAHRIALPLAWRRRRDDPAAR